MNEPAFYDFLQTMTGTLFICVNQEKKILGIRFSDTLLPFLSYKMIQAQSECDSVKQELSEYFEGKRKVFSFLYCFPSATDFQISVWNALIKVPYGNTCSYGDIARSVNRENAVRAVANAIGANRILVCIPCHRIIRSDGLLSGYSGGISIKKALLDLEKKYS